ncbi:MAG: allantoate amidohydrolase, partial [Micropruina sp.]
MNRAQTFRRLWDELAPIGRTDAGGYRRFAWTLEDAQLRAWFAAQCERLGLAYSVDRAGNQWGWWVVGDSRASGVATGSHLDSVPDGGAFDGPLGVVSALIAIEELQQRGFTPRVPLGVV